jgi:transposase
MVTIREKVVSFWSKEQYDHALYENRKFLQFLNEVIENPNKINNKQKKIKKYFVEIHADKATGEVIDTDISLSLDMKKIEKDLALMGYYTLLTSEIEMDEHEVIDKYHGLSRIEDSFRTIKSSLEGRPVFVNTDEHINAHFLLCFIALTMIRIIQYKILVHLGKETKNLREWEFGLSADRIIEALDGYIADAIPSGFYRVTKPNEDRNLVMNAFGIEPNLRIPSEKELRQLKYRIDKLKLM